jgi:UDP-N-acetyl-D-glucosamine/UDP-N-acetyl-D-galactosamine dehydrogenase
MNKKIAVIGLGYTGAPLAFAFAKKLKVIGYDLNKKRIKNLNRYIDENKQITKKDFKNSRKNIFLTTNQYDLSLCNFYIIAVPTPVNKKNLPDLSILINATKTVAKQLKKGDFVIYESTVYPGVTEDICIPILEKISNFKINNDFYCGFSPERINPGDKKHSFAKINKIVSSSNKKSLNIVAKLYQSVIKAKITKAENIKSAEASKIIENTQRDVNIALINEFSIICKLLKLNVHEVLKLSATKWNFLNFKPGLVGGHCIGVDPFYLSYKSKQLGYKTQIVDSGRNINEKMSKYLASHIRRICKNKFAHPNILILGYTFKENCSDFRNTKVLNLIKELNFFSKIVDVVDPYVDIKLVKKFDLIKVYKKIPNKKYDVIFIAVGHDKFKKLDSKKFNQHLKDKGFIFDFKNILNFKENVINF